MCANVLAALWSKSINKPNIYQMMRRYTNCGAVLSRSVVSNSLWSHGLWPPGSSVHGDSPGENTRVGCHALLQGIFPTQELNPGLPHSRRILYHSSHQGHPKLRETHCQIRILNLLDCICRDTCFIFKETHKKDSDKYCRIQVSDNFKIVKLNWIGISRTNGKTGLKQNKN